MPNLATLGALGVPMGFLRIVTWTCSYTPCKTSTTWAFRLVWLLRCCSFFTRIFLNQWELGELLRQIFYLLLEAMHYLNQTKHQVCKWYGRWLLLFLWESCGGAKRFHPSFKVGDCSHQILLASLCMTHRKREKFLNSFTIVRQFLNNVNMAFRLSSFLVKKRVSMAGIDAMMFDGPRVAPIDIQIISCGSSFSSGSAIIVYFALTQSNPSDVSSPILVSGARKTSKAFSSR